MNPNREDRLLDFCRRLAKEEDPQKLMELVTEVNEELGGEGACAVPSPPEERLRLVVVDYSSTQPLTFLACISRLTCLT